MGIITSVPSVFKAMLNALFVHTSGHPAQHVPICFLREQDYTIKGTLREGAQSKWNQSLYSMIFHDLKNRRVMWEMIKKRMDRMEASLKYTNCNLEGLVAKFTKWDEKKIFDAHDLFQAFEVDGDGLIEITEMSLGLDNLGDKTNKQDRIAYLSKGDEDGTGSIDFEEFLQILYEGGGEAMGSVGSDLTKTFGKVNSDVKKIRWMSTVQQIAAGYL